MEFKIKRIKKLLDLCYERVRHHLSDVYEYQYEDFDDDARFHIDSINYWFEDYDELIKELIDAYENNDNRPERP